MSAAFTKRRKADLAIITLLSALAFVISELLAGNGWFRGSAGLVLFTVPSIIYLCIAAPKPLKKILTGSLLFGLGLGYFFEFVMQASGGYNVVGVYLPRLFGQVPVDSIIAHFLMTGLILTFYEHFAAKTAAAISRRVKFAAWMVVADCLAVTIVYALQPGLLSIPYPYAVFGTLAVLPIGYKLYRHPEFFYRLALIPPFFFGTFMLFMIVAIHYGWWLYPAGTDYIGWVFLFGNVAFPFEELLFWMLLYAPAIVTYYSVFVETDGQEKSNG